MTWRSQPARPPTPPHLKRYAWLRLYSDFPHHPKWRAVATASGLPLHEILAVAIVVLCKANVGRPRGSLAEFSLSEAAAALDLPGEHVVRIYGAMVDQGWIDGDFLVTWDERQPDREDPTNKARQQRFRDRRKAEREAARNGVTQTVTRHDENSQTVTRHGTVTLPVTPVTAGSAKTVTPVTEKTVTPAVTRHGASRSKDPTAAKRAKDYRDRKRAIRQSEAGNGVTCVTSRPEKTRSIQPGDNISAVEWEESAEQWLSGQGLETVKRCGKLLHSQAQIRIGRWRSEVGPDALRDIIHQAAALAVEGRFLSMVGEAVARIIRERGTGLALPLPPVRIAR